jgi:UDP-N-acetylglucosamine 1-carboxyvinyltransferase
MDVISIRGNGPLRGTVSAAGSKNASLLAMTASIMADGPIALGGVPGVTDVNTLALLLGYLGVETKRHADGVVRIETIDSTPITADMETVSRMRASFCVLGPLVARRGRAAVALPGGCRIGSRPIDLHLQGLAALGANIRFEHGMVIAEAQKLRGVEMNLSGLNGPTVTGTANVLMAAVLARGETILRGAAREPEIIDLCEFLNSIGARIEGARSSTIRIKGVEHLSGGTYQVIPDRMETGTLLLAAAITGGDVTVRGSRPEHLESLLAVLDDAGVMLDTGPNWIRAAIADRPLPFQFTALPHPGVPTDLQAQCTALATLAEGRSTIADQVFPDRFAHLDELSKLGACVDRCGSTAIIDGVHRLQGNVLNASDLRAAAALVLAGLAAQDVTTIRRAQHLFRGYDRLIEKLNSLGADVVLNPTEVESESRSQRQFATSQVAASRLVA